MNRSRCILLLIIPISLVYYLLDTAADINYLFPPAKINRYLWLIRTSLSSCELSPYYLSALGGSRSERMSRARPYVLEMESSCYASNHRRKPANMQTSPATTPAAICTVINRRNPQCSSVLQRCFRTHHKEAQDKRPETDSKRTMKQTSGIQRPESTLAVNI